MTDYTLSAEQQVLVEANHNLIYKYANSNNIDAEEFYGVLAIGLCKAASLFDASRGFQFSTLAYRCMETEYKAYWRHELNTRHIPPNSVVSYNTLIANATDTSFLDIISNSSSKCSLDTGAIEVEAFIDGLSPTQRIVLEGLMNEEKEATIAKRLGCTRSNVSRMKKKLGDMWRRYATKHLILLSNYTYQGVTYMAKSIRCNMCGKVFDIWDAQEDFSIERLLGYGTKHDGDALQLDLCCDCMEKIIDKCKISPIIPLDWEDDE